MALVYMLIAGQVALQTPVKKGTHCKCAPAKANMRASWGIQIKPYSGFLEAKKSEGLKYQYPPTGGATGGSKNNISEEPRRGFNCYANCQKMKKNLPLKWLVPLSAILTPDRLMRFKMPKPRNISITWLWFISLFAAQVALQHSVSGLMSDSE